MRRSRVRSVSLGSFQILNNPRYNCKRARSSSAPHRLLIGPLILFCFSAPHSYFVSRLILLFEEIVESEVFSFSHVEVTRLSCLISKHLLRRKLDVY